MTVCKPSAENGCNHERNKSRQCSHELFQSTPPTPHSTIMHVHANSDFEALLFQNANGEAYSSASFTKQLQQLFERLTGRDWPDAGSPSACWGRHFWPGHTRKGTWKHQDRGLHTCDWITTLGTQILTQPRLCRQSHEHQSSPYIIDTRCRFKCFKRFPLLINSLSLLFPSIPRDCDDSMKDSLAAALRHSREQAQRTYDRRTANEKKAAALELARRKAEEPSAEEGSSNPDPTQPEVAVGQFVGLVAEDSTLQKPSIFLGRVQAFLPDDQVCLLWYRNVGGGVYSLQLDGSQWTESRQSLVPVEVASAKGRPHAFRLRTSLRTIHKAVLDGGRDPWPTGQEGRTRFSRDPFS